MGQSKSAEWSFFLLPIEYIYIYIYFVSRNGEIAGLENELVGYVFGKKKATEVAHL